MKRASRLPIPFITVLLVLSGAGGCQFVPEPTLEKINPFGGGEKPAQLPDRIMAIWSDTVLHQPQQPGVRGFGGRVYFYRGGKPDPIKVDGGLVVYAFDSEDLSANATKPEKKYVFTADQLAEHMSYTDMGPSYSVWLPWDEIGGPNRQLSLIARFEGRNGGVVLSKPTIKLLPGVGNLPNPREQTLPGASGDVAQAAASTSHSGSSAGAQIARASHLETGSLPTGDSPHVPPSNRTRSMTIDLPPSFRRHLIGPTYPDASRFDSMPSRAKEGDAVDRAQAEPIERSRDADQDDGTDDAAADQGDSRQQSGESSDQANRSLHPPSRVAAGRFDFQDRRQPHSFRTLPTPDELSSDTGNALSRPAGWLKPPPPNRR